MSEYYQTAKCCICYIEIIRFKYDENSKLEFYNAGLHICTKCLSNFKYIELKYKEMTAK